MIEIVAGKVGGGKTYYAVSRMVQHWRKGGTVYTNIEIRRPAVARYMLRKFGLVIRRDQIRSLELNRRMDFHKDLPLGSSDLPILVILDEVHLFFNARDWKRTDDSHRDVLSWMSQSRKAGCDVILIAQKSETIDGQIRSQAEFLLYTRDMRRFSIPGIGKLPLGLFVRVYKDVESEEVLHMKVNRIDRGLFPLYDTRSFLDDKMRGWAQGRRRVPVYRLRKVPLGGRLRHSIRVLWRACVRWRRASRILRWFRENDQPITEP